MLEFSQIVDFHYGLPFFIVDFVDQLTGSTMITDIDQFFKKRTLVELIQASDEDVNKARDKLDDFFMKYPWILFSKLAELDFAQI